MSTVMDDQIKRWTAKRKSALVVEIFQGKTTVAEASRSYDLPPSEIESAYGEAMLELRARKKLQSLLGEDEK